MDENKLQMLVDRTEVIDVVTRYANSIGMHDWAGLRSCYTDEVEIDYTSQIGGEPLNLTGDAWTDWIKEGAIGFKAVMHYVSNHSVTINGDEATCISYVHTRFYLPIEDAEDLCTAGGYYTNEMVRTADGWKINKSKLTAKWSKGNEDLFAIARERAKSM